jgi:hypothetical protein
MGILGGILGQVLKPVTDIVSEVVVDKDKRDAIDFQLRTKIMEVELEMEKMMNQQMLAQVEINKIEAGNKSLFVSGWRPFIGWSSGISFAWSGIGAPIVASIYQMITGESIVLPVLAEAMMMPVMMAMLGVAGLRTAERFKGVASDKIKTPMRATRMPVVEMAPAEEPSWTR